MEDRHLAEKKALSLKVAALKKSVKGSAASKQQKAAVAKQVDDLENELFERQKVELEEAEPSTEKIQSDLAVEDASTTEIVEKVAKVHISKGKRNKNKKLQQIEQMQMEARQEVKSMPNLKEIEDAGIEKLAKDMDKKVVQVPADGHCLYYSISRQLKLMGNAIEFKQLRSKTAQYLRENRQDFIHFLLNKNQDLMTEEEYENYCKECEFGATWGGQTEVIIH